MNKITSAQRTTRECCQNELVLNKNVLLASKLLITTKNAVILTTQKDKHTEHYKNAYRIIHGPNHDDMTKVPYIILYKDETANEVTKIVEELVKEYPEEFEDNLDSYIVPILCNGQYWDKRIKWLTA